MMTLSLALAACLAVADDGLDDALRSMVWYHGYTVAEMAEATGRTPEAIRSAVDRLDLRPVTRPERPEGAPLLVLPYPGGRHPRIGFRDGAVDPRRETKLTVVTPWEPPGYVVLDLPEAIWWGDRLLFLAHTHVPTIWTERGIDLDLGDWSARPGGGFSNRHELPNGVVLEAAAEPTPEAVFLTLSLTNGTDGPLEDLRVQNCVLLGYAPRFDARTSENKVARSPYVACRSEDGRRWIVTAWEPIHRAWDNPPCPCLHADPRLPDCPPGETVSARGVLAFVEAADVDEAIARVESTGWRTKTVEPGRSESSP